MSFYLHEGDKVRRRGNRHAGIGPGKHWCVRRIDSDDDYVLDTADGLETELIGGGVLHALIVFGLIEKVEI